MLFLVIPNFAYADSKVPSKNLFIFETMVNNEGKAVFLKNIPKNLYQKEYSAIWKWAKNNKLGVSAPNIQGAPVKLNGYTFVLDIKDGANLFCSVEDRVFGKLDKKDPLHQSLYPGSCASILKVK